MPVLLLPDIARVLSRGLFGYMDEEDKPRGLLGLLDRDDEPARGGDGPVADEQGDEPARRNAAQDVLMRALIERSANTAAQFEAVRKGGADFLGHILTNPMGIRPPTYDPVTGRPFVGRYTQNLGERFSESTKYLPLPGGIRPPPGPTAPAPVTTLPRSTPGFLFGGPQAKTVENEVYRLPPEGEDETTDDCTEEYLEEMKECDERFSFDPDVQRGCEGRAAIRLDQCKRRIPRSQRARRWSDADVDGWLSPRRSKSRKR